jgi:general nucleoside transport system permease protein
MRIRFEKRLQPPVMAKILTPVVSFILALIFGGILLLLTGANPITAYRAMGLGAFGELYNVSETLLKSVPLILCGLAVAVAFRMRLWNIGAEGQLTMGACAAAGVGLFLPPLAPGLGGVPILVLMLLAAVGAGALWAVIPGALRAWIGVNEVITTLMFNYIALAWLAYLYSGPWRDVTSFGFPKTASLLPIARLPQLFGTRLHAGVLLALAAVILVWIILGRTKWGYEIRVLGENPRAARYAGINVARNIILVMALSGGLAGMAGMSEVAGLSYGLQKGFLQGYGFTAIIVAWMAELNPFGVVLVSVLLAGLMVGGDQIQLAMRLPASMALVLQGAILLFMLAGSTFTRYRVRVERRHRSPTSPHAAPVLEVQP